ncbi:unnamed protein product [Caenorhabditis auriculariae]|uniref:Histone deacetylase 11 n=1 Tax=Caenorhabditis auriculariae TaxID=2777116 RepID=A0A8S1HHL1_9PELO|nr:unnamed protein product [Caenorhabditis auriculariae]
MSRNVEYSDAESGSLVHSPSRLFVTANERQCSLIFAPNYDVSLFGIERFHPFDSRKWGKVINFLKEWGLVSDNSLISPIEATRDDLLIAHDKQYLDGLRSPCRVAAVSEVCFASCIPMFILDRCFLKPMRLQTGGTVAACRMALDNGWSINVGGGFHHASRSSGGGFCAYADISLAIRILLGHQLVHKVLILDVDAHQGNGYEQDFAEDSEVYIIDVFNPNVYPRDRPARQFINRAVYVDSHTTDSTYMRLMREEVRLFFTSFHCDLLVYNAGTDCLAGDPLGGLRLSPQCIIDRDEFVFRAARDSATPIAMLTSGGYQSSNAALIAASIRNLHEKRLIHLFK